MKKNKPEKPYWEMTTEELAEATKEFDRPIPLSKTRPLTKEERQSWERAKRGPHHSVFITRDINGVFVRLPPDILQRSVRYAAEHKLTLSQVIHRSLKGLLTMVE